MAKRKESEASIDNLKILKQDIKQGRLQRGYIFYGEEDYLRLSYLELVKKTILNGPAADLNYHRFTKETLSWDAVSDAVESFPMMAEKTLVQIDDINLFKEPEEEQARIRNILSDIPEHCCLILNYAGGFERDGRKKKLSALMESAFLSVEFPKQGTRDLIAWIRRHAKAGGKDISDENCQLLCFYTGNNMTTMASELPKLTAYASGPSILKTDIEALVEPVLEVVVFDITDAISSKDFPKALQSLQQVLRTQKDPIEILAAIGSNLRRTHAAKVLSENGKGIDALLKLTGLRSEYAARKTMEAARRVSMQFCEAALVACMQTDWQMKTSADTPQRLLEMLIIRLSQEAQRD